MKKSRESLNKYTNKLHKNVSEITPVRPFYQTITDKDSLLVVVGDTPSGRLELLRRVGDGQIGVDITGRAGRQFCITITEFTIQCM